MKSFSQYINEGQQEKIDACTFLGINHNLIYDAELYKLDKNRYETTIEVHSSLGYHMSINAFFKTKFESGPGSREIAIPDKTQNPPYCTLWYKNNNMAGWPTKKTSSMKKIVTDYYAQFQKAYDNLWNEIKDNDKLTSRELLDIINKKHKQNFGETAWNGNILSLTYTNRNYDKAIRLPSLRLEIEFNSRTGYTENLRPMFGEFSCGKLHFHSSSKDFLNDIEKINKIVKQTSVL